MIRVTVELLPGGNPEAAMLIASAAIANLTPWQDPASYVGLVRNDGYERLVVVKSHDRSHGVWALLHALIEAPTVEGRSPAQETQAAELAARLDR